MNIQSLRYLLTVAQCGSINLAARQLYLSQSALSRMVKEMETRLGFSIFQRSSRGVTPTADGQLFLEQARHLVAESDRMEQLFHPSGDPDALLVVTQRCSPVVHAFSQYYTRYCQTQSSVNLALLEQTTDSIIRLVCEGFYGAGILHYTSDQEQTFFHRLQSLGLSFSLLDRSPVAVQVRRAHPLAQHPSLTTPQLSSYPHVAFSDEDITHICFCSDIAQFCPEAQNKRILVRDRGSLLGILLHSDSYFIGSDFSGFPGTDPGICYLPLRDVPFTLNTLWIQKNTHTRTVPEERFFRLLTETFQRRAVP